MEESLLAMTVSRDRVKELGQGCVRNVGVLGERSTKELKEPSWEREADADHPTP